MRRVPIALVLLSLIAALAAAPAFAEVFTCTDARGNRHYADALHKLPESCRDRGRVAEIDAADPNLRQPPKESETDEAPEGEAARGGESEQARKQRLGLVDRNGHDESWWREKKRRLEEEKRELEAKLRELEALAPLDPYGFYTRKANYQREQKKLKLKQEIAAVDEDLAALADEARKAGAQPGWLR